MDQTWHCHLFPLQDLVSLNPRPRIPSNEHVTTLRCAVKLGLGNKRKSQVGIFVLQGREVWSEEESDSKLLSIPPCHDHQG